MADNGKEVMMKRSGSELPSGKHGISASRRVAVQRPSSQPEASERRVVFERDGKLWTTSLDVARVLDKEHEEDLKALINLDSSQEFRERNFALSSYRSFQNKPMPMFELTESGLMYLAMSLTGKGAARFKVWYLSQFQRMRESLKSDHDLFNRLLIIGKRNEERLEALMKDMGGGIGGSGRRAEREEDN